jgi:hypothetical protein
MNFLFLFKKNKSSKHVTTFYGWVGGGGAQTGGRLEWPIVGRSVDHFGRSFFGIWVIYIYIYTLVMIIYMKNNKYFNSGNKYLVDI